MHYLGYRLVQFNNIKAIFFDLDGTLFETAPELVGAINNMLSDLKMPPLENNQITNFIGRGADNLIRKSIELSSKKSSDDFFVDAIDAFHHHYGLVAHKSLPYEGVMETIKFIQNQDIKMACITNKPSMFTDKIIDASGLTDFFDLVLSGDTLEKRKPDPLPVIYGCDYFNIKPIESIMVGDSINDIEAGHSAGAFVVTVPYGYQCGDSIVSPKVSLALSEFSELQCVLN
jgi:phosphoglycolate phosphatase